MNKFYLFTCFILQCLRTVYSSYDVEYYEQKLDHFNFQNVETFHQKYLISKEFWNPDNGSIFFYPGNEGSVELFCNNTGFMWELAPNFSAIVIFAEHRYYGDSTPKGNSSSSDYYGYLSTVQALADYAELLTEIRQTVEGARKVPIIAFGGSYGGMLAAWMRMKYPNIIEGAIASSAPLMQFAPGSSCDSYVKIVTEVFKNESAECVKSIRKSWDIVNKFNTTDGRKFLSDTFHLCEPINSTEELNDFKDFLASIYNAIAMVNYPQETNFISALPSWPVKVLCSYLNDSTVNDEQLMSNIFHAVSVYMNYTGFTKCFDQGDVFKDVDMVLWEYQECTELVTPWCSTGVDDMFEPQEYDFDEISNNCNETFHVIPDPSFLSLTYGGAMMDTASNIVYSNGNLDPWSGGGVTESPSSSVVSICIENAAHHVDLRASHPDDPPSVVEARKIETALIHKWIADFKRRQKQ